MSNEARRKYERDAARMVLAVRQWKATHAGAELVLYMPEDVFVCSPLDGAIMELVARDELARSFVAWVDQRTDYQGTLEMLRAVCRIERISVRPFTPGDLQIFSVINFPERTKAQ